MSPKIVPSDFADQFPLDPWPWAWVIRRYRIKDLEATGQRGHQYLVGASFAALYTRPLVAAFRQPFLFDPNL